MSLSQYSSATFSPVGHARKFVSVQLSQNAETQEPSVTTRAIKQLRDFFAGRADVADKNTILSSIERHLGDEIPERRRGEIVEAALTRTQRKVARRLGFEVQYRGRFTPEA